MDDSVKLALAKWPNVPHCYGWLSLDRRGQWRLQGDPLRHAGLTAFIGRNYGHDGQGQWFFQNGPQRVYVHLDYLPWVLRLDGQGQLLTHTDAPVNDLRGAWLDEDGTLLLDCEHGPALLDDRDLTAFIDRIHGADGKPATESALLACVAGDPAGLVLYWNDRAIPVLPIRKEAVAQTFGIDCHPQAASVS